MKKALLSNIRSAIVNDSTFKNKVIRKISRYYSSVLYDQIMNEEIPESNFKRINKAAVTLSFDCDMEEDYAAIPLLLEKLRDHNIKASFACIGRWIEKLTSAHEKILADGHEIVNHTFNHPSSIYFYPHKRFNEISTDERKYEIEAAHLAAFKTLGYEMTGFRTPHFGNSHTSDIYNILKQMGYHYSSSTISIKTSSKLGEPFHISEKLLEFPLSITPFNITKCFDSYSYFRGKSGSHTPETEKIFFEGIKYSINKVIEKTAYFNVYFDPADLTRYKSFTPFLEYLDSIRGKAEIITYNSLYKKLQLI